MGSRNAKYSGDQILNAAFDDSTNKLNVGVSDVVLSAGDIEIGAVELKDASTTARATVGTQGDLAVGLYVQNSAVDYANPVPVSLTGDIATTVGNVVAVSATDLDIRDLTGATDTISLSGVPAVSGTVSVSNTVDVSAATTIPVKSNLTAPVSYRVVNVSAGTAVQFSSFAAKTVFLQGVSSNTSAIAIGDSSVLASAGFEQGMFLDAMDSMFVEVPSGNMSGFYMDAAVSGEAVTVLAFT